MINLSSGELKSLTGEITANLGGVNVNVDCVWYKDVCNLADTGDCTSRCIRFMEMRRLCELAELPKQNYLPPKLYADGSDRVAFRELMGVKQSILDFVHNGSNLYIYSESTGNGKTSWATRLLVSYFNEVWSGNGFNCRGVFVFVPKLLAMHKASFSGDESDLKSLVHKIYTSDLVVWDDIAVQSLTPYEHTLLLTYIDYRITNGLSNIYTGNADEENMKDFLGQRLYSRVWGTSRHIHFTETDKRNKNEVTL